MTPDVALLRWPEADYPSDSLGGMQRDIVVKFWTLAEEAADQSNNHPFVLDWLAASARDLAAGIDRIDELQEQGLRTAFASIMGYELPE